MLQEVVKPVWGRDVVKPVWGRDQQGVVREQTDADACRRFRPRANGVFARRQWLDRRAEHIRIPEMDGSPVLRLPGDARHLGAQLRLGQRIARRGEILRIEEHEVDIREQRRNGITVKIVPHDIADDSGADEPVGQVHGTCRLQDGREPRVGAEDALQRLVVLAG
jgi:hypothetical protein